MLVSETTRNSIAHGMLALTEHRDQWQKLREQPALMPSAVREIVRHASPVLHMRRTATCDATIGDQPIRSGDKVVLWYVSGNPVMTPPSNRLTASISRDRARYTSASAPVNTPVSVTDWRKCKSG